jgi:hypothetical protein
MIVAIVLLSWLHITSIGQISAPIEGTTVHGSLRYASLPDQTRVAEITACATYRICLANTYLI